MQAERDYLGHGKQREDQFNTMKDMILNEKTLESEPRFQFSWLNISKDVITKNIKKSIRSTVSEKRTIDGYSTLPFGFED